MSLAKNQVVVALEKEREKISLNSNSTKIDECLYFIQKNGEIITKNSCTDVEKCQNYILFLAATIVFMFDVREDYMDTDELK